MEFLVCCVFAYWLVKHIPQIAGETAEAITAAWNGTESPGFKDRRERLENAGIDPAAGGAFGQYVGNLWNDFWLDQDNKRRNRPTRTSRPGMFGKLRDKFDAEVDKRSKAWRQRDTRTGARPGTDQKPDAGQEPPAADQASKSDEPPTSPPPHSAPPSGPDPDQPPSTPPPGPATAPEPPTAPVRVPSTVGQPVTNPNGTTTAVLDPPALPATERNPDMTQAVATNGGAVTGVVSGAAEARSIERYLEQATEAYNAAMANARKRIHALGEQSLGTVQLANRSDVVTATAQAAESIAAAQAGVNLCKAETIPLLGLVARNFDRLNS